MRTCPGGRCREGALLIGIMTPRGRVAYLDPPMEVSEEFVGEASRGTDPEHRFRFAEMCAGSACHYWESGCRLGRDVAALADTAEDLPACGIRATCRWFAQEGPHACSGCRFVVREPNLGGRSTP